MSENSIVYSIQSTYILTLRFNPGKTMIICNQRIDIPTIEPLPQRNVVPCIELEGNFLTECDVVFETNEGVTVLPVEIKPGSDDTLENPYQYPRYVLVLPRGTTGVKSCKIFVKGKNTEIQHNFTFGIMPPPYNYDNPLFGYLSYHVMDNSARITALEKSTSHYGYAEQNGIHTIDFSSGNGSFTINPDTRFLTFSVTNPLQMTTTMSIDLTSKSDESKRVISSFDVSPGLNTVKFDLQALAVFVENVEAKKADSYIIPPMQDRRHMGICFTPRPNTHLPGNVRVTEWA